MVGGEKTIWEIVYQVERNICQYDITLVPLAKWPFEWLLNNIVNIYLFGQVHEVPQYLPDNPVMNSSYGNSYIDSAIIYGWVATGAIDQVMWLEIRKWPPLHLDWSVSGISSLVYFTIWEF